jgi:hypothetical protein
VQDRHMKHNGDAFEPHLHADSYTFHPSTNSLLMEAEKFIIVFIIHQYRNLSLANWLRVAQAV